MAGTMTAEQAANTTWKCAELSGNQAATIAVCDGIDLSGTSLSARDIAEDHLDKRSLYTWLSSSKHVSSQVAVGILTNVLYDVGKTLLTTDPRSYCVSTDGTNACFSWSRAEAAFSGEYAAAFVSDALGAINFNAYIVQRPTALLQRSVLYQSVQMLMPVSATVLPVAHKGIRHLMWMVDI